MADTTNPLPSVSEPFVDRFRRINPVWLRWLKPLLETVKTTTTQVTTVTSEVNGLTSTVTQVQESVDGYAGRWSISYNVNGKVLGAIKLDGSATYTTFDVLSDKFSVSHPTSTGVTINPFVVGLVGGVSTIGIDGEVIVDGSITADALNINTLSEASADAGVIVNGTLKDSLDVYEFDIANGYFGRQDGSSYIDMKNNVLQFTT